MKAAVSRHRGLKTTGVFSADFDPPAPWRRFYIWLVSGAGENGRRQLGSLNDEELAWVGRTVAAELERRKGAA